MGCRQRYLYYDRVQNYCSVDYTNTLLLCVYTEQYYTSNTKSTYLDNSILDGNADISQAVPWKITGKVSEHWG